MKKFFLFFVIFFICACFGTYAQRKYVRGHYRDGHYVAPYYRSSGSGSSGRYSSPSSSRSVGDTLQYKVARRSRLDALPCDSIFVQPDISVRHIVQPGETIWHIARKYNMTAGQLMYINDLGGPSIVPGQILKLK